MGKYQLRKGKNAEREVVRLFREYGLEAYRVPLSGATEFQKGDVVVGTWVFEVKRRQRRMKIFYEWLKDVDGVIYRVDRHEWLVVLPLKTFAELLREVLEYERYQEIDNEF